MILIVQWLLTAPEQLHMLKLFVDLNHRPSIYLSYLQNLLQDIVLDASQLQGISFFCLESD